MLPLLDNVRYLLSEVSPQRLGSCAAEVTFIGRSNVGKSTLLNALFRKDLAKTSSRPGCTRTINVFLAGKDRWLVDLPGYGYAEGPAEEREKWGAMIEAYLTGRPNLRKIFALVDAKVGPTRLDLEMLKWLQVKGLPWRIIATKSDQVKSSHRLAQRRGVAEKLHLAPEALAWVSADKGTGIPELRAEVAALLAA